MPLCPSCGEQNPERAKFCLNCGTALAPRCPSCGEENPERAKFCLNCGTPLTGAAPPAPAPEPEPPPPPPRVPDEERKLDTLVFVDLVGSTALAESLDPEDVMALLELYYTRLRAELERHGGTVEKYIGDAIVTHFGVPVAHEDDPERAVRAALDILGTVEALNAEDPIREIKVRIGVATGEVIVTHGQKAEEGKGIAWGDVLNTAARIESAAPVNGILVGEETYRATAHRIDYREHEPIEAKGKDKPVPVWQAVGVKETPVGSGAGDAPLVGREAELEQLLALWEAVRSDGRPALATIIGDPGIGKSRLLAELAHRASEVGDVLWGRCLSYGEGITYWPIEEMLEGAGGILKSDGPETVSTKLGVLLERFSGASADEFRTIVATLENLVGVADGQDAAGGQMSQAELHWGIRRVFELLAQERPVVLVLEDMHWAEPTLFDLIDFIGEAAAPILVLVSARPELSELRPALCVEGERRAMLALSALGAEHSEALLAALLGDRTLPPGGRAETLLRNAAGNPLFLEETVRMLDDAGVFDGTGDLSDLAVPTSLQAMIGSRLDGLPGEDKSVANHASVVGMTFWSRAVAELHGAGAGVDPNLEALEQRDFVRAAAESSLADEREWTFKHALIRDVAYARVPKGRRASLHVRFADWMESMPGAADELVEILAYHLEQACKHSGVGRSDSPPPIERAVRALMAAAEKAERRAGIREADRYYARALDLVANGESEQALELRLGRAGTLNKLGDFEAASSLFGQVAEAAPRSGRDDLRGWALLNAANIALKRSRPDEARPQLQEAGELGSRLDIVPLQIRVLFETANLHSWIEGDLDTAVADLRAGLEIADNGDDMALRIEGRMRLVTFLYNLGLLHGAEAELTESAALLEEFGSLRYEALAAFLFGLVKQRLGEIKEAEAYASTAHELLERTGERFFALQNLRTLALCAMARGDLPLAESRLQEAIANAAGIGGQLTVDIYRCLVDVMLRQNRLADARTFRELAEEAVEDEDVYARAACLLMDAGLMTAAGQDNEARACFVGALELLEQQNLTLDLQEARMAYGRALRRFGDIEAAVVEFEAARTELSTFGAAGLVDEIDRELAEIGERAGRTGPLAHS